MYGIIYKIRNKLNNKIYFGQTVSSFKNRYGNNLLKFSHNNHLKNSIKKYGIDNFEIDEEFDIAYSKEELNKLEYYYIELYNTTNPNNGYNKIKGGNSKKLSTETLINRYTIDKSIHDKIKFAIEDSNLSCNMIAKAFKVSCDVVLRVKKNKYKW